MVLTPPRVATMAFYYYLLVIATTTTSRTTISRSLSSTSALVPPPAYPRTGTGTATTTRSSTTIARLSRGRRGKSQSTGIGRIVGSGIDDDLGMGGEGVRDDGGDNDEDERDDDDGSGGVGAPMTTTATGTPRRTTLSGGPSLIFEMARRMLVWDDELYESGTMLNDASSIFSARSPGGGGSTPPPPPPSSMSATRTRMRTAMSPPLPRWRPSGIRRQSVSDIIQTLGHHPQS